MEEEWQQQLHNLTERVKELNCLYGISELIETPGISMEGIFRGTVELLPRAWQYPCLACARIVMKDQAYETANFQESTWRLASNINVLGEPAGVVEVFYLQEPLSDGPTLFLPEEVKLLNAVAERLGRVAERIRVEEALWESEQKYRNLFDNAVVGMFRSRIDGSAALEVNQALCDIFDCTREELFSEPTTSRWVNPKVRREMLTQANNVGMVTNYEADLISKRGEIKNCLLSLKLYRNKGYLEGTIIDITARKRAEKERENIISELQKASSEIKTLSGMLPICASCKKIRDDSGYWKQIESYIKEHSEAEFSHGICPDCAKKLYPEYYKKPAANEES